MKERLIIIFVALIAGLFITSAGFFIYQSTKKDQTSEKPKNLASNNTQSENENGIFIKISEPADESLTDTRSITIKGSTNPGNTVIVSTNLQDEVQKVTDDGNFSISVEAVDLQITVADSL